MIFRDEPAKWTHFIRLSDQSAINVHGLREIRTAARQPSSDDYDDDDDGCTVTVIGNLCSDRKVNNGIDLAPLFVMHINCSCKVGMRYKNKILATKGNQLVMGEARVERIGSVSRCKSALFIQSTSDIQWYWLGIQIALGSMLYVHISNIERHFLFSSHGEIKIANLVLKIVVIWWSRYIHTYIYVCCFYVCKFVPVVIMGGPIVQCPLHRRRQSMFVSDWHQNAIFNSQTVLCFRQLLNIHMHTMTNP